MHLPEIPDPLFRRAVSAIDAGDVGALAALLAQHPELVRDRLDYGEGYFRQPYLLWFVAENPIRHGRLPKNIVEVAQAIVAAAKRERVDSLQRQLDYALGLVASGAVPRQEGVQIELIDTLVAAGATPASALVSALAHRELAAAGRLLEHGAPRTLLAAVCSGRADDVRLRLPAANAGDKQAGLIAAAFFGLADLLPLLLEGGADVNAYGPADFHPHATSLHQAVDSGSLAAVRLLVEAGADLSVEDRIHHGTPLGWAEYLGRPEIAAYLRERAAAP